MAFAHHKFERRGRTLRDDTDPNLYQYVSRVGEKNVDVNGDGTEFARYHLNNAILRHGDQECEFAEQHQVIRRLGQAIVSRSRLFIQRLVGETWTDVPHGIPTRNVAHDYPSEGKCTAYLDFPNIQGYAQGSRLQVGIEVGGGDDQIYRFRMRSPVAGTFRLEWVLDIPDNVPLSWIYQDSFPSGETHRVGARIGNHQIRWTAGEDQYRAATIEDDPSGGKIVHLFLGPYILAAMEWLDIYPDTFGPADVGDDCYEVARTTYGDDVGSPSYALDVGYYPGYGTLDVGMIWRNVTVPAGATINTGSKITIYGGASGWSVGTGCDAILKIVDARSISNFSQSNRPSQLTYHATTVNWDLDLETFTSQDSPELNTLIQQRLDDDHQSGDDISICWYTNQSSGANLQAFKSEYYTGAGTSPKLTIVYTVSGPINEEVAFGLGISATLTQAGQAAALGNITIVASHGVSDGGHAAGLSAITLPLISQLTTSGILEYVVEFLLNHSQGFSALANASSQASMSIESALTILSSAQADAAANFSLTNTNSLSVVSLAQAQAAIDLVGILDIELSSTKVTEAIISLAKSFQILNQASASTQSDITLSQAFSILSLAMADTFVGLQLSAINTLLTSADAQSLAILVIAKSLGLDVSRLSSTQAAITLAQSFQILCQASAAAQAMMQLGGAFSITLAAEAITEASLAIATYLGLTTDYEVQASQSADFALASTLGLSTQALAQSLALVNLPIVLGLSAAGNAAAASSFAVAYSLAQSFSTTTIQLAAMSLAINTGLSASIVIDRKAAIELGESMGLSISATASAIGQLTFEHTVALTFLAQAVAAAGFALTSILSITISGTAVSAIVTFSAERTITVSVELRMLSVPAESRILEIPAESRIITILPS